MLSKHVSESHGVTRGMMVVKVAIPVELLVRARMDNPKTTHFCDEKRRRIAKEASRTFKNSFLLCSFLEADITKP